MHDAPVLCARTLAAASGGDVLLEHELLELFVRTTQADACSLDQALATRSLEELQQLAHLVNGRSRVVGALFLARACERIEHAAPGGDWVRLRQACERFRREWMAVREAVRRMRS